MPCFTLRLLLRPAQFLAIHSLGEIFPCVPLSGWHPASSAATVSKPIVAFMIRYRTNRNFPYSGMRDSDKVSFHNLISHCNLYLMAFRASPVLLAGHPIPGLKSFQPFGDRGTWSCDRLGRHDLPPNLRHTPPCFLYPPNRSIDDA
jgi:hypothetical protein